MEVLGVDVGNKRIVQITGFERELNLVTDPLQLLHAGPKGLEYRILVMGNSFAFFNALSHDKIGDHVERLLREDRSLKLSGRTPKVVTLPIVLPLDAQTSVAKEIVSLSNFDFVLLIANANDFFDTSAPQAQMESWHKGLSATVKALSAASIQSLIVFIPEHWMVTPLEVLYSREGLQPVDSDYKSSEPSILKALQGVGAPVLNLFPAIRAYETAPFVKPLYANEDLHPSSAGRAFIAAQIVKRLKEMKPWGRPALPGKSTMRELHVVPYHGVAKTPVL